MGSYALTGWQFIAGKLQLHDVDSKLSDTWIPVSFITNPSTLSIKEGPLIEKVSKWYIRSLSSLNFIIV